MRVIGPELDMLPSLRQVNCFSENIYLLVL